MKTYNCRIATFFIALALLLSPIASHAQRKPQEAVALTLEDILACAHSPTM
jgi:hypothetical protein